MNSKVFPMDPRILLNMFSFMTFYELMQVRRICKSFNHLIKTCIIHHTDEIELDVDRTTFVLSNFGFTFYRFPKFKSFPDSIIQNVHKCRTLDLPLDKIDLLGQEGRICCNQVTEIFKQLSNCVALGLHHASFLDEEFGYLTKCHTFKFTDCHITDQTLEQIGGTCESLYLKSCPRLRGEGFQYLTKCTRLIFERSNIDDSKLQYLSKLDQLEYLRFRSCNQMTGEGFQYLPKQAQVEIIQCVGISGKFLCYFTQCTELDLTRCLDVTDEGLKFLTKCRKLSLSDCNDISDQGLSYLSNCKDLNLRGCDKITDKGLAHLKECRSLTVGTEFVTAGLIGVIGGGCIEITDKGIAQLVKCEVLQLYCCSLVTGATFPPTLKEVVLRSCHGVLDQHLIRLSGCTKVSIYDCLNLTGQTLGSLSNCHTVEIGECPWLNDRSIGRLSRCTSLKLSNCANLTDRGLSRISSCLNLTLINCHKITDQGFRYLFGCRSINLYRCRNITIKGLLNLSNCRHMTVRLDKVSREQLDQLHSRGIRVD